MKSKKRTLTLAPTDAVAFAKWFRAQFGARPLRQTVLKAAERVRAAKLALTRAQMDYDAIAYYEAALDGARRAWLAQRDRA
jgi:hypothetical protein